MGSKLIFFIFFIFGLTTYYFSHTPRSAGRNIASEVTTATVNELNPSAADVLIVIDRNPRVQQMRMYMNGSQTPQHTFPVSTGRETFDFPDPKSNPYCSNTPTGVFSPDRMRELHLSNTWQRDAVGADGKPLTDALGQTVREGSPMPYSVFFNGGIAIHSTIDSTRPYLGTPASGGCVRLAPEHAKIVFDEIAQRDAFGSYQRSDPRGSDQRCVQNPFDTYCTDARQWPVRRQNRNVKIQVVDSRSEQEKRCADSRCIRMEANFQFEKENCLRKKIQSNTLQSPFFNPNADITSSSALRRQLSSMMTADRVRLNEECNREIRDDHKARPRPLPSCDAPMPVPRPADLGGRPASSPAAPATTNTVGGEVVSHFGVYTPPANIPNVTPQSVPQTQVVPMPQTRPTNHPVPPANIPNVALPTARPLPIIEPAPRAPNTPPPSDIEGLWMKEFKPL